MACKPHHDILHSGDFKTSIFTDEVQRRDESIEGIEYLLARELSFFAQNTFQKNVSNVQIVRSLLKNEKCFLLS